jgi:hypothetical protein
VIKPTQRPLLDNTQYSRETDNYVPGGIRTHNPSSEQPQTHALDGETTGTNKSDITTSKSVKHVSLLQADYAKYRHFKHLNMDERKLFERTSGK